MQSDLLESDWKTKWATSIQGKYQKNPGDYGEFIRKDEQSGGLDACKRDCEGKEWCNSVGEDTTVPGKCWLAGHTEDMTGWFTPASGHNIYFKNKTNMRSELVDVTLMHDTKAAYADLVGVSGRSDTTSFKASDNPASTVYKWNHFIGANGQWWDDHRGEYGCPKIGVITGGDIVSAPRPNRNRYDLYTGKGYCNYNRIYNPTETVPTGYNAVQISELDRYFKGKDLVKAKQSWCMMSEGIAGFDNIMNKPDCQRSDTGFDYKLLLAKLLPNDWYSTDANCERFKKLGELLTVPLGVDLKNEFISKINKLPIDNIWSASAIGALNTVMNKTDVSDEIKTAITNRTTAYCNNKSNSGKDAPECGCKNAIEGWQTRKTGGCTGGVKGCDDVISYINALDEIQKISPGASALMQFDSGFVANRDSQACIDGHANGGKTVLAFQKPDAGEPQIKQLCVNLIQALDQSTLSIKGDVTLSCKQSAEAATATDTGGDAGAGDADDEDFTDGGDDEPAKNNLWLWIIIGLFSCMLMLGIGTSLLFLF
jgi:hypothetical protein